MKFNYILGVVVSLIVVALLDSIVNSFVGSSAFSLQVKYNVDLMPRIIVGYFPLVALLFMFYPESGYYSRNRYISYSGIFYLTFVFLILNFLIIFVTAEPAFYFFSVCMVLYSVWCNLFNSISKGTGGVSLLTTICVALGMSVVYMPYHAFDLMCRGITITGKASDSIAGTKSFLMSKGCVFYYPWFLIVSVSIIVFLMTSFVAKENIYYFHGGDTDFYLSLDIRGLENVSRYFAEKHYQTKEENNARRRENRKKKANDSKEKSSKRFYIF